MLKCRNIIFNFNYRLFFILLSIISIIAISTVIPASAVSSPGIASITAQWANPQRLISIEKKSDETILTTIVNGKSVKFYISFPKEGGVRFRTDTIGYFKPSHLNNIKYYKGKNYSMVLESGKLKAKINYDSYPWSINFLNDKDDPVYTISARNIFFGYKKGVLKKVKLTGTLVNNEVIYGLGERNNAVNQVGKTVKLWNSDCSYQTATASVEKDLAYVNVPILNSSKGYSLFFNSYYGGTADIGDSNSDEWQLDFNGTVFDVYIYSKTTKENMGSYTNLTGKPFVAPKWAFGYWAGHTNSYWNSNNDYNGKVEEVLSKYKAMNTLPSAIYLESNPFREDALEIAKKYGVKGLAWNNPTISLLNNSSGENKLRISDLKILLPGVKDIDLPAAFTSENKDPSLRADYWGDYSNPNMKNALKNGGYTKLLKNGLSGAMVDYGEYQQDGWYFYNGMKGDEMHNFNGYCYTKTIHDIFEEEKKGDYVLFARAGTAGSQSFAGLFAGDQSSTFDGLRMAYYAGLSSGASGFSNWGSDIGGLSGELTQQLYLRWLQFGAFSPFMRTHGNSERNPWGFGKIGENTFVELYNLRNSLIDYLYSSNLESGKTGCSMIKTMPYSFQYDNLVDKIENQYTLGDELFVAPILDENSTYRNVVFPKGKWTDLWNGKTYSSGMYTVNATINTIPVYLRDGAVIKVNLSNDFSLTGSHSDKSYDALLVAPTSSEHVAEYFTDNKVYSFKNKSMDQNSFTVSNLNGLKTNIVVAAGTTAKSVKVNGKNISKLKNLPSDDNVKGYYVDYALRKTYIFTGGEWNNIYTSDSNLTYKNLALSADVKGCDEIKTSQISSAIDGDYSTSWSVFNKDESEAIIDLESNKKVRNIVLNWNAYTPESYKLEISKNGNTDWIDINKSQVLGGTENFAINQNIRFVRLSNIDKQEGSVAPGLQEIEIYGDELVDENIKTDDNFSNINDNEEYENTANDSDDNTVIQSDSVQDNNPSGKRLKRVLVYEDGMKTWVVVLIIVGSVIVVAAITLCTIIFIKKRRKNNL